MKGTYAGPPEVHAYVDRELDPVRALAIETSLACDDELAAWANGIRAQKSALHAAFDAVLAEPLPRGWGTWLAQRLRVRMRGRSVRRNENEPDV